jgi:ATP-dependent DNA helicase DinG
MPDWATSLRAHQVDAIEEAVEAFNAGAEVVFMDAPTGSGKTLIGQRVAAELDMKALYICTDKQLQQQFADDFPYARQIKGRNNYRTQYGNRDVSADDCTAQTRDDSCMWCDGYSSCPYQLAKSAAKQAPMAVLNTSYFLTTANYTKEFTPNELVIVDEADALESALMGFIEYTVPEYVGRALGLNYPIKGARKPTIIAWLQSVQSSAAMHVRKEAQNMEMKTVRRWKSFIEETGRVAAEIQRDVDAAVKARDRGEESDADGDESGRWLRDYDTKTFTMKPVLVSPYGPMNLWRHGKRWLIMSATIISPDEMVESLGIPFDWECVTVPMTFPVENRPIILAPVGNVTYKEQDATLPKLVYALEQISAKHAGERILVHTVSYALNRKLFDALLQSDVVLDRQLITHEQRDGSRGKLDALARYRATPGAMMLAPSMERGVDLSGEDCRVVVVVKVPFPALGDKRISARVHLPGGQQWYTVQTIRDIVQMTGRGVRSEHDYATTYILDTQFVRNVWSKAKLLFPAWWREAVDATADTRWLVGGRARSIK